MGSSPAAQVDVSSFDQAGISVATATRSATNSRLGSFYDNTTIAAGAPVHVHPLSSTQFLATFARRWTAATPSPTQAGYFSAYAEDTHPSWFILGSSGARTLVDATPGVPVATPGVAAPTLTDGASMGQYLYLLHSTSLGGLVQHFRVGTNGRVVPVNEEVLPDLVSQGVTFDKGLALDHSYLTVFGSDSSGHVFLARKPWGQIGSLTYKSAKNGDGTHAWAYGTGSGWDANPANATPEPGLMTNGPISHVRWRRSHYVATVATQGSDQVGQVYSQFPSRPWVKQGAPVLLGSTSDGSYLGGTMQLQSNLLAPSALVNTPASETAIPYVTTQKVVSGVQHALTTTWGLLQLPRQT